MGIGMGYMLLMMLLAAMPQAFSSRRAGLPVTRLPERLVVFQRLAGPGRAGRLLARCRAGWAPVWPGHRRLISRLRRAARISVSATLFASRV